jgi:hypothetical protein
LKKDLPENKVEDVSMAVVLESESPGSKLWKVYLINLKNVPLTTVLVSSRGYGLKDGSEVKTSVLRHMIGDLDPNDYAAIEVIDEQVFGLTNEYWLSYYINGTIYDRKFIFLPESIVESNLVRVPVVNKAGVVIGS